MPPKSQSQLLKVKQAKQKADNDWKKEKASKNGGGSLRHGVANAPRVQAELSGCTDAVCAVIVAVEVLGGKPKTTKLSCDVGQEDMLTIVTTFKEDLAAGMRVVIAMVGSYIGEKPVAQRTVKGVVSQGELCDGVMLGWADSEGGSVARIPGFYDMEPGDSCPPDRPKRTKVEGEEQTIFALAEMKLTKEEKKAQKEAKKAEKARLKRIALGLPEPEEKKTKKVKPTKADIKRIRKETSAKRKAGEECDTDDEMSAAGFLLEGEFDEESDEE
jgi:tRNA-binding EMAP/Myf-like protein